MGSGADGTRQTEVIGQSSNLIATLEGGSRFIQTAFQSTCRNRWTPSSHQRWRSGTWRDRWSCWPLSVCFVYWWARLTGFGAD